jgi:hypothetical protein
MIMGVRDMGIVSVIRGIIMGRVKMEVEILNKIIMMVGIVGVLIILKITIHKVKDVIFLRIIVMMMIFKINHKNKEKFKYKYRKGV